MLSDGQCRWHFLLQAKKHTKWHRDVFTLERRIVVFRIFIYVQYVLKLKGISMFEISVKCSIWYYNFIMIAWLFNQQVPIFGYLNSCYSKWYANENLDYLCGWQNTKVRHHTVFIHIQAKSMFVYNGNISW